jgi:hypothetical protein
MFYLIRATAFSSSLIALKNAQIEEMAMHKQHMVKSNRA